MDIGEIEVRLMSVTPRGSVGVNDRRALPCFPLDDPVATGRRSPVNEDGNARAGVAVWLTPDTLEYLVLVRQALVARMRVHVMACLEASLVYVSLVHFDWNTIQMSMPYFGLSHQRVGELRDICSCALQQYRF